MNGFEYFLVGLVIGFVSYYMVLFYMLRDDIRLYVSECMKYVRP